MNEEFQKPYKKLQSVEEQNEFNFLLELYSSLYKQKFKGEPIFPIDNIHFKYIKDFKRSVGGRAPELLEHFFKMKDEWFIKQAYSLDCLVRNINKVNASYSSQNHLRNLSNHITVNWLCDCCWESFVLTVPKEYDFNKLTRCSLCTTENKPYKRITKEERQRAVMALGAVFKEVKKEEE